MDAVDAAAYKAAMRRLAAGVAIVTGAHGGTRGGLTATAVCSLSAEPPQLLVCVNRQIEPHDIIRDGAVMGVSLLGTEHRALAARFAGMTRVSGAARFGEGSWLTLKTGASLLEDAVAAFDCVITEAIDTATHTVFIGKVVAVRVRADAAPLLYAEGEFQSLARLSAG